MLRTKQILKTLYVRYRINLLMARTPAENKIEFPSDGKIRRVW